MLRSIGDRGGEGRAGGVLVTAWREAVVSGGDSRSRRVSGVGERVGSGFEGVILGPGGFRG